MAHRPDRIADIVVVGTGNAAACAALAALEAGADVELIDAAGPDLIGGNSRYTAGAMRFAYDDGATIRELVGDLDDPRLARADFGSYPQERFAADLERFNAGAPLRPEQRTLVADSQDVVRWLVGHGVGFEPIWDRQSVEKDGRRVFWGGLPLATRGEGQGLVDAELAAVRGRGGRIRARTRLDELVVEAGRVVGVRATAEHGVVELRAGAVVLACGGFEADERERVRRLGPAWSAAKVRGTPLNTGIGIRAAVAAGAVEWGTYDRCHATPMDRDMPDHGGLHLPARERKRHRKICYHLGVMLDATGRRFVDEGADFRNYTYAQYGRIVLERPGHVAWQVFDARVADLLYDEYRFEEATFVEADTLESLVAAMTGTDAEVALATLRAYNEAVDPEAPFDPSLLDGAATVGLDPPKSNWALPLDRPPYRAYPVTGGITFTYGGLRVDDAGAVLRADGRPIAGLHAAGELVGGVFVDGYPGGSGLTSGAVFGRRAGRGAAAAVAAGS